MATIKSKCDSVSREREENVSGTPLFVTDLLSQSGAFSDMGEEIYQKNNAMAQQKIGGGAYNKSTYQSKFRPYSKLQTKNREREMGVMQKQWQGAGGAPTFDTSGLV